MRLWPKWLRRATDRDGFSVIEVLVAVAVFAFAIMAMASSTNLISRQMNIARRDMRLAFALQEQMELLLSQGYANLTPGTYADTVGGFPMNWAITGTNPRTIVLVASFSTTQGTRADTVITQVADPTK